MNRSIASCQRNFGYLALLVLFAASRAATATAASPDADSGYRYLVDKAYLPADFDEETFAKVWEVWPEPLRERARAATPAERREMAFRRYGLTRRHPDAAESESQFKPLQYVVSEDGVWTMNCFACHGGQRLGEVIPGLPNWQYELETLTEEMRLAKLRNRKSFTRMDVGSLMMPLGRTRGTTNAVMFGVALMSYRDADLNIYPDRHPTKMVHHDMDPPPWWHFQKKSHIYIDGFAQKGSKGLMQFMLVKENGPDQFHEWATDFENVYAFLESIEPPFYPGVIDGDLADQGRLLFNANCSQCHGTYGTDETYPERMVPIDEIGTDPVRWRALSADHRAAYGDSWFADHGQQETLLDPAGYVAPPLDGIWASAPYFHNGSVPTLWGVLHPEQRPTVWRHPDPNATDYQEYDHEQVGLHVLIDEVPGESASDDLPPPRTRAERRRVFDTSAFGKSATGHTYPDALTEPEKQAVLEFLKTL